MKQVRKFYLASFLKNQTYFVPIIVLFFQDLGLSYSQIFWIFTIGAVFSFVVEIPTGIFADVYGKRRGILISKFLIFISFLFFAIAKDFYTLLFANLVYELGKSFRSGTETAYVFSYLKSHKYAPGYTIVKAKQKFYARISESIATALGGYIAYKFGFSMVFYVASLPALLNFIQTITWQKLDECQQAKKIYLRDNIIFARDSFKESFLRPGLRSIILNTALFGTAVVSLDKFIQPYMKDVGIDLQYFGIIYSAALLALAFLARYSANLEEKFGALRVVNYLSIFSFVPVLILALGLSNFWGIILFFIVLTVENIRSPIANSIFYEQVSDKNRATMGSILELFKSSSRLIFLPLVGHLADWYSISWALYFIAALILISSTVFYMSYDKVKIKFY